VGEILNYLLWKHRQELSQATCLLSGFGLGAAAGTYDTRGPVFTAALLLAVIVAMMLAIKNVSRPEPIEEATDERPTD
jgi:hypothetical protein